MEDASAEQQDASPEHALERYRGRARSLATLYATAAAAAIASTAFTPLLTVAAARISTFIAGTLFLVAVGLSAYATILTTPPASKSTADRQTALRQAISRVHRCTRFGLIAAWAGIAAIVAATAFNQFGPAATTAARIQVADDVLHALLDQCPAITNPITARIPDQTSARTSDWLELQLEARHCDNTDQSGRTRVVLVPIGSVIAVTST